MPSLGAPELILILVVVLIIFGAGKLPDVGRSLGQGIKEFKKATNDAETGAASNESASAPAMPSAPMPAAPSVPPAPVASAPTTASTAPSNGRPTPPTNISRPA